MALIKNEKVENNRYELQFAVEHDVFEAAVEKVYRREVKKINVNGFRKGKAPRSVVEKMYGKGVFYEDAINEVLPDAFEAALAESALDMVGQPEFDIVKIDDEGLVLKALLYVKPDVNVKEYRGLAVTKTVTPVTDEDVEHEIYHVRERQSRTIEVSDRPAKDGDVCTIDYEGFADGVPFEGGKDEGYDLKLGSGQFIPGFEDQIVGHNVGDAFDVNVTFPTEYHAEELAGKEAVFKVVLHKISEVEIPELDDEFVKDVSEFSTVDEYKADIRANLESKNEKEADKNVEEQIIDALIANLEADIPAVMFDAEAENFVRDYDSRLRMSGLDLKSYLQYTGQTLDQLREQFKPMAERQVKTRLALEKIVALENITADDDEIEKEYNDMAAAYNMKPEEVKQAVKSEDLAADICVKKAVDFVKANAVVSEAK